MKVINQHFLIYLFCFAILIGGAYNTYVRFDFSYSVDSKSYMKMAKGDFDVTVTHRYRVIIPYIVGKCGDALTIIYPYIWKNRGGEDWSLRLAFLVVNALIMSGVGLLLYQICLSQNVSLAACIIALLAFFTSRWAYYVTGLPLIDSLYLFVIAALFYGLIAKNQVWIAFALIIGPLAKESFLLFLPLVLVFNYKAWKTSLISSIIGLAIFWFVRLYIDLNYTFSKPLGGLENALNHAENIGFSLQRIFSIKGLGELIFTFGLFNGLMVYKWFVTGFKFDLPLVLYLLLPIVGIHMLLSGDIDRMLYLAAPNFCVEIALGADLVLNKWNK